jgi:hypothetical protein
MTALDSVCQDSGFRQEFYSANFNPRKKRRAEELQSADVKLFEEAFEANFGSKCIRLMGGRVTVSHSSMEYLNTCSAQLTTVMQECYSNGFYYLSAWSLSLFHSPSYLVHRRRHIQAKALSSLQGIILRSNSGFHVYLGSAPVERTVPARTSFARLAMRYLIQNQMGAIPTTIHFVAERSRFSVVHDDLKWSNGASGGHSVTVTVVDRCAGCKEFDIDLSPTPFSQLAAQSRGRSTRYL